MAVLYCPHYAYFTDNDGNPLAGGKLYTYEAGTTTPKATYTAADGLTPNANPIILDASGRATLFLSGAYKFRLETSDNVLVEETDNVDSFATSDSGVDDIIANFAADTMVEADSIIFADVSDGNTTKRTTLANLAASASDIQTAAANKIVMADEILAAVRPNSTTTATASGSDAPFTSLTSGIRRIVLTFDGVSSNGTGLFTIEIGDSGGYETSGYVGTVFRDGGSTSFSTAFTITSTTVAADLYTGVIVLYRGDTSTNTWHIQGTLAATTGPLLHVSTGSKSLSATLDRLRVVAGGNTWDAGKITCETYFL
jgi:hypothetical protein